MLQITKYWSLIHSYMFYLTCINNRFIAAHYGYIHPTSTLGPVEIVQTLSKIGFLTAALDISVKNFSWYISIRRSIDCSSIDVVQAKAAAHHFSSRITESCVTDPKPFLLLFIKHLYSSHGRIMALVQFHYKQSKSSVINAHTEEVKIFCYRCEQTLCSLP